MAKTTDDLEAVRLVTTALAGFSPEDQERIIRWAREKLGLAPAPRSVAEPWTPQPQSLGLAADSYFQKGHIPKIPFLKTWECDWLPHGRVQTTYAANSSSV
jgi:hypothetical protein